jgi:hypothetical protein
MLRLLRESRSARLLLLAAGFLAVSASFGLHPEPGSVSSAVSSNPAFSARLARSLPAHECPACLTHRAVSLARLAATVLRPESIVAAPAVPAVRPPDRLEARPQQNRAPPVTS